MPELQVIRQGLATGAAVERVRQLCGGSPMLERELLYPYYRFAANGRLRFLFGERKLNVDCLIDARTGHAATADAFDVVARHCEAEACLDAIRTPAEARRLAQRYATHALSRGYRIAANFNLQLVDRGVVHRPFCIVASGGDRLLVDRVSGELHPLASAA